MEIEIISKGNIKPASPTPDHLRTHKLSILDQLNRHMYINSHVFFYPNNPSTNLSEVILERRQRLKRSLSETLGLFYPLAGKIKDNLEIECNDDGAYYVEAQVNIKLSDFLAMHENELINQLLPVHPCSAELLSKTHLVMVQISIFDCGGISVGIFTSHKIVDGLTMLTFMKAWATAARECSEQVLRPSFISPSVFRPDPNLSKDSSLMVMNQPVEEHNYVTKRFLFDHSALVALKTKFLVNPSSVTMVMGLLWKTFISTSKIRCSMQKPFILSLAVDLRARSSPPLPPHSFGNIFWVAFAKWCVEEDSNLELPLLINKIKGAIATINNDFVEGIKGEDPLSKLMGRPFKDLRDLDYKNFVETMAINSICRNGLYDTDFGWGKPIWSSIGTRYKNIYGLRNQVLLLDTRSGDGIEAWVTLKEDDMAIFEKDSELLAFASLNPSPFDT